MASQSSLGVGAAWYADPCLRHELRYWDGEAWTEHVSDRGQMAVDPVVASTFGASGAQPATTQGDAVASRPPGSERRTIVDPNTKVVLIPTASEIDTETETRLVITLGNANNAGSVHTDIQKVDTTCRWEDLREHIPGGLRTMWEASLAEGEVPRIVSSRGLLATDRALLVDQGWPGKLHNIGRRADRYEFKSISDVDEDGFMYAGARRKLKWRRDDSTKEPRFLWALLAQEPQLAPVLVVQQAEMTRPESQRAVKIGCLDSVEFQPLANQDQMLNTKRSVSTVGVVTKRDPSLGVKDYYQFVACPACGTQLRLRVHRPEKVSMCSPGYSSELGPLGPPVLVPLHIISKEDDSP